jgi:predicted  nucleic acid-binding Zn-ribbon protein
MKALGVTAEAGVNLVVDQKKALKAITGYANDFDAPRDARSEAEAARIAQRVAEIVALAATVAKEAGSELTNAQLAWRAVQKQFSETNVAILKDLGFSAKQIKAAQNEIKNNLAEGFNREMVNILVDTGRATKHELDVWKRYELEALGERRRAALRTAREIGGSEALVLASFKAQSKDISKQYTEMLDAITPDKAILDFSRAIEKLEKSISSLTTRLNDLDSQRSDVIGELTRRSEAARDAEQALLEARRGLAGSNLAPGNPMTLLKTLQSQFGSAISAARGGDAGAASTAASLAQSLLQQGQQVYGSSSAYSSLFKSVNTQLAGAQGALGTGAKRIERQLDPLTFTQVTERSTASLLKALSTLNASIAKVEAKIEEQNKQLARTQAKARVA